MYKKDFLKNSLLNSNCDNETRNYLINTLTKSVWKIVKHCKYSLFLLLLIKNFQDSINHFFSELLPFTLSVHILYLSYNYLYCPQGCRSFSAITSGS